MNKVYLVGAGCGKDLLTLRGAKLLRQADCVVYDSLLDESLLELCRENCVRIFAGKRSGGKGKKQEEINQILLECGRKYAVTVRLKGGDPYVFGRGGEEMLALLSENISCESVPGVTSAIAAAELAGMSEADFRALNPSFKLPVIVASHNNVMLLPADRLDFFVCNVRRRLGI